MADDCVERVMSGSPRIQGAASVDTIQAGGFSC